MPQIYSTTPAAGGSSIGSQIRTDFYQKKALVEMVKERYFGQLADVTAMPKHMGKTIKRYHYMPLLDDANVNDQGIDASGYAAEASGEYETSVVVTMSDDSIPDIPPYFGRASDNKVYFSGRSTTAALAADAAGEAVRQWIIADVTGGGLGLTGMTTIDLAEGACTEGGTAEVYDAGFRFADTDGTELTGADMLDSDLEGTAVASSGNLYGSSKDIGTIDAKMPTLSETGGRVSRVGFKRVELEGTIEKFGFFQDYTQESLDFDTDAQLQMHINREMLRGANEMTEDALQIDLIQNAGVVRFPGTATAVSEMVATQTSSWGDSEVTYGDLMKLSVDLDNNRCPKNTKIITGSRNVDTKVVRAARILYAGSEMTETFERMTDYFGNQAFIPLAKYAAAGSEINGEIGSIGNFRIVIVPEMMHHAGDGAAEGVNAGYRATNGKVDAYPLLVVGSESFTTIGFQTSGKTTKFKIYHKAPGLATANSYNDPYGEVGFMSIKWYYGFMALRPERIALIWSVARW